MNRELGGLARPDQKPRQSVSKVIWELEIGEREPYIP